MAVRVTLDPEQVTSFDQFFIRSAMKSSPTNFFIFTQVCYEAGSQGATLPQSYMNALDDTLIPIIHNEAANFKLCFELLFQVLVC
jgi:hypothetical protein